jgi:hypothetical protein
LDLRGRKWREAGEDCVMRSFITCAVVVGGRIILEWHLEEQVGNMWTGFI